MNFNTIKQELNKKIKNMSEEDFQKFIKELKRIYYKDKPQERIMRNNGKSWRVYSKKTEITENDKDI